jgi:DNA polymerase-4
MHVSVVGFKRSWHARIKLPPTQDTITVNEAFLQAWQGRDFVQPKQVGVTFTRLVEHDHVTPSLFDPTMQRSLLNKAVDSVNQRFGKHKVYLAGLEHAKETADERIAFGKTELFSEGKGDNEWVDTFRGPKRE